MRRTNYTHLIRKRQFTLYNKFKYIGKYKYNGEACSLIQAIRFLLLKTCEDGSS